MAPFLLSYFKEDLIMIDEYIRNRNCILYKVYDLKNLTDIADFTQNVHALSCYNARMEPRITANTITLSVFCRTKNLKFIIYAINLDFMKEEHNAYY